MKIMTITDSPNINSGLARVHRNVINGFLDAGHEVIPCVWHGYTQEDMDKIKKKEKPNDIFYKYKDHEVRMYCLPKGMGENVMFATCDAISSLAPDIVFTIGDYWNFYYMKAIKSKLEYCFKWVFYPTIEETKLDDKWRNLFFACDKIISPTQFGADALKGLGVSAEVIPYGVNEEFKRYSNEEILKLRQNNNITNKVRFALVAQNTYRKNIPSVLLALKHLKDTAPKSYAKISLYIHTNIMSANTGELYVYDLIDIAEQLGICDALSFPTTDCSVLGKNPLSDKELADIYNMSDYLICPSSCEGFGLPILEAMACGLPVIGAMNTATREHLINSQTQEFGIDTHKEVFPPARIVDAISSDDLSCKLLEILCEDYNRAEFSTRVEKYAKSKTWEGMQAAILETVNEVPNAITIPVEVL